MTEYLFPVVWILSSVYCGMLDKQRRIPPTAIRNMAYALFGPVAIPVLLVARRNASASRVNRR